MSAVYRIAAAREREAWEALCRHRARCLPCRLAAQVEPLGKNECTERIHLVRAWDDSVKRKLAASGVERKGKPRGAGYVHWREAKKNTLLGQRRRGRYA